MTSKNKPGRPSSPATNTPQSTSRRSARQERLAARAGGRDLKTAGTRGGSGGSPSILVLSGIAIVVGLVVIVAAILVTGKPSASSTSSTNFTAPLSNVVTPTNVTTSGETIGNANAPVTLDLYSDFRCTGCGAFVEKTEAKLITDFVVTGKVKVVYHNFLLIDAMDQQQGIQTTASRDAANAGLCAADEGKFWQYHDWLFANQSSTEDPSAFTIDRLIGIAKAAAIDSSTFESCVKQGTHNADVAKEQTAAPSWINSTPTLVINGNQVKSSLGANYQATYDDIAKAISAATPASSSSATPAAPSAS